MTKPATIVARIARPKRIDKTTFNIAPSEVTIATLSALWFRGDLAVRYPDHVRVKKTAVEDARRFQFLNAIRLADGSTFGSRRVVDVTLDDCEDLMAALPETAEARSTRRNYALLVRRLLVIAVYPLRIRESLPIPTGWLPRARGDKAKSWLYPNEELALMQCAEIPLGRRLFFGVLAREGMRVSEALGLTWSDVDLRARRRQARLEQDRRPAHLGARLRRRRCAHDVEEAHHERLQDLPGRALGDRGDFAHHLREGLKRAGVARPELFAPHANRLPLRAHDLRGSFVTLALAIGRTEAWVTDRTGHRSSAMVYTLQARRANGD